MQAESRLTISPSPSSLSYTALITMGGQAQVVTFALDSLIARGTPLRQVLVLHLAPTSERVAHALHQLRRESNTTYRSYRWEWKFLTLSLPNGDPLPAIRTEEEARLAWAFGRDLLLGLKQSGERLHLCLAGGPRLLAMTLLSAAMLHCDHEDHLWHLYTPRDFLARARNGAILHAPPSAGVHLLPIPLLPLGAYFPALQQLNRPSIPTALPPQEALLCQEVWDRLTPRQREILRLLAEGMFPQEVADTLSITLSTLDSHKSRIYAECRIAWSLSENTRLTYHFLREKFGPWLRFYYPTSEES